MEVEEQRPLRSHTGPEMRVSTREARECQEAAHSGTLESELVAAVSGEALRQSPVNQ